MMRVFQVMAEPYFRAIRVFRVSAEAETWLAAERLQRSVLTEISPVNSQGEQSGSK
jgi:cupin superfamily acireductone dioxygenase involved in methionine salvage